MKKKLMAVAAAAMIAAAGTVHAEFYDDRTSEYVEGQIENGVGYIVIYSDRKNNGDFAGMVRDNRVRNGQTEPKMTIIRACFVCAEKTFKQAVTDFFRNWIAGIFHG